MGRPRKIPRTSQSSRKDWLKNSNQNVGMPIDITRASRLRRPHPSHCPSPANIRYASGSGIPHAADTIMTWWNPRATLLSSNHGRT